MCRDTKESSKDSRKFAKHDVCFGLAVRSQLQPYAALHSLISVAASITTNCALSVSLRSFCSDNIFKTKLAPMSCKLTFRGNSIEFVVVKGNLKSKQIF